MEKKLYRSRTDRMIGGVAGGLGEYFGLDPVLVRIIFVILALFGGSGILIYIIGLIIIPEEPEKGDKMPRKKNDEVAQKVNEAASKVKEAIEKTPQASRGKMLGGLILILLGLMFLGQMFWPGLDGKLFLGALLILIGFFVLSGRR